LLTNLGAVNFDLPRVKENLLYLVSLSKDSVIPHAYYWRDDGFKTEYCEPENWNHLWFILVTGSYLRHSLDDSTGLVLYPSLRKSVHELLTRLRSDGLMYAYRPDWWDIGHIEGSRAYLTALTVRALREYLFISSFLHKPGAELLEHERTADLMQHALVERLWDSKDQYLTNFNGATKDYHFYAGSLIAPVYDLLDQVQAQKLVATAARQLVDQRIGTRIAVPADFATDSVIRAFKFAGAEAGPAYSYANGGVWPHSNAWYALALKSVNKLKESFDFVQRTMTIDGIAQSRMDCQRCMSTAVLIWTLPHLGRSTNHRFYGPEACICRFFTDFWQPMRTNGTLESETLCRHNAIRYPVPSHLLVSRSSKSGVSLMDTVH